MRNTSGFRDAIRSAFESFVNEQQQRFPENEAIRVDIHCHDKNSDVPDERLGRMLKWPETWATTEDVLSNLAENGATPITITNHNNARSCWQLRDEGMDILPAAEFSCTMPDFDLGLHVLTYGFTPSDEEALNARRKDLYRFLEYTTERDIATVLAHPLFFYKQNGIPPLRYLERLSLLFDNFEVINGQRDARQNLLVAAWIESLDEERIHDIAAKEHLSPATFCRHPFSKAMTGGSDCHMALFAGHAGTLCHVSDLGEMGERRPMSEVVKDCLLEGRVAPFGAFVSEEKLTTAFLDYFCQVALHAKDPGLIRLLLHKGEIEEKLLALGLVNAMMELRRHSYTTRFLGTFYNALHGKRPGFLIRRITMRDYRPMVSAIDTIARSRKKGATELDRTLRETLPRIFRLLDQLLADRIMKKVEDHGARLTGLSDRPLELIERLEVPAYIRALFSNRTAGREWTFADILDGLPFPALAASVLGGAHFAGARAMYANRPLIDMISKHLGRHEQPQRVMWLTDTYVDRNGVSTTLQQVRKEVHKRGLPIDFVVVSSEPVTDEHVIALSPLAELKSPYYKGQAIRFADVLELHKLFVEGGYDRVVCSTEGPMGLMALYLKHAFSVPAYFYLHTDWLDFAEKTLAFDHQALDRLRRILRAYYRLFDGIFVLNGDQEQALKDEAMGIPPERIFRTAHFVSETFRPRPVMRNHLFPHIDAEAPLLLFAGRVSEEKGVLDLPLVMKRVRQAAPNAKLAICGEGPALDRLKALLPDDIFMGWVDEERLASVYAACDVMLFPSTFDTFGNAVLEAHACGLPVIAYAVKGPKEIIADEVSGYLVSQADEMTNRAIAVIQNAGLRASLRKGAIERASCFRADLIMDDMLNKLRMSAPVIRTPGSEDEAHPSRYDLVS